MKQRAPFSQNGSNAMLGVGRGTGCPPRYGKDYNDTLLQRLGVGKNAGKPTDIDSSKSEETMEEEKMFTMVGAMQGK